MSYFLARFVTAEPERVGMRLFRNGSRQEGLFVLALYAMANEGRLPTSMQELLQWIDDESDVKRIDYQDFDWHRFEDLILGRYPQPVDADASSLALPL